MMSKNQLTCLKLLKGLVDHSQNDLRERRKSISQSL